MIWALFSKNSLPIVRDLDQAVRLLIIQVLMYTYLQGKMNGTRKDYKAGPFDPAFVQLTRYLFKS
jgi:hypothetical protein